MNRIAEVPAAGSSFDRISNSVVTCLRSLRIVATALWAVAIQVAPQETAHRAVATSFDAPPPRRAGLCRALPIFDPLRLIRSRGHPARAPKVEGGIITMSRWICSAVDIVLVGG